MNFYFNGETTSCNVNTGPAASSLNFVSGATLIGRSTELPQDMIRYHTKPNALSVCVCACACAVLDHLHYTMIVSTVRRQQAQPKRHRLRPGEDQANHSSQLRALLSRYALAHKRERERETELNPPITTPSAIDLEQVGTAAPSSQPTPTASTTLVETTRRFHLEAT